MAGWSAQKNITIGNFINFGFASIGRYAYLIGGYNTTTSANNSNVYIYDSILDSWSLKTSIPANYHLISHAVSDGNYIYCVAQYYEPSVSKVLVYIYKYDPINNTWQSITVSNIRVDTRVGLVKYSDNKIIFFPYSMLFNTEIYYINQNQWITSVKLPEPDIARVWHNVEIIENKAYIVGGQSDISGISKTIIALNRTDILDTINFEYDTANSMIYGKALAVSAVAKSEIYIVAGMISGMTYDYGKNNVVQPGTSDVQIFNAASNQWRFGVPAPFNGNSIFAGYQYATTCNDIIIFTNGQTYYIFDTRTASISNPSPTAGFVNEKIANTFSWILDSGSIGILQQSATFQWRIRGAQAINTINVGTTQSAIVPANTLPQGEFEWRVSATNTAGIVAPFTEWFLLTTIDQKPNKPAGLYPNTGSRDGTKPISFSWIHNAPLSTPQSAFEVQITYDGGTTWRNFSNKVTTATTQFNAAANTILPTDPTGRFGWRVRTYNSDDVASEWSDTAFFIVHPAPQPLNWISVESARSKPLARWTSLGQVGYQIQVLLGQSIVYDSGEVFGISNEYRITEFLNNGVYTFQGRIKNIRGLWSDWRQRAVSINARHSLNITLRGETIEGGAAGEFDVEVKV